MVGPGRRAAGGACGQKRTGGRSLREGEGDLCEILSPDDPARDRVTKSAIYAEWGMPFYWIIDSEGRTVGAFRLVDGQWLLQCTRADGAVVAIRPFPELDIVVSSFFVPKPAEPTTR